MSDENPRWIFSFFFFLFSFPLILAPKIGSFSVCSFPSRAFSGHPAERIIKGFSLCLADFALFALSPLFFFFPFPTQTVNTSVIRFFSHRSPEKAAREVIAHATAE